MNQIRSQHKRQGESGQAAVLACLCMFTMVVFVMLSTNIGTLASDRIRMQNVADVAAYAGALEQARNLNIVRKHNSGMMRAASLTRAAVTLDPMRFNIPKIARAWLLFIGSVKSCNGPTAQEPEKMIDVYEQLVALHKQQMVLTLRKGQKLSVMAAQLTAEKNMTGLGFGRSFNNYRANPGSPTFGGKPILQPPDEGQAGLQFADAELVSQPVNFNYGVFKRCKRKCRKLPFKKSCYTSAPTRTINAWWYKKHDGPSVYFPMRLIGTPLKQFFDVKRIGGYFGASPAKPHNRIRVFSVAKPYNGGIGPHPSEWPNMNGTTSMKIGWTGRANIYPWEKIRDVYEDYFERGDNDYRARMVGIQALASDMGSISGTRQLMTGNPDPRNPRPDEFDRMLH